MLFVVCCLDSSLRALVDAVALERRDLDDGNTQLLGDLCGFDGVVALLGDVHLVERHDNGNAKLHELLGQIQVALEVGRVDDVDDRVNRALRQKLAGDDLLFGVRGQRVDARQVNDLHVVAALELAALLLNRNAGPVAHVLMVASELVEQGGLTRVGVAHQGQCQSHVSILSFSCV